MQRQKVDTGTALEKLDQAHTNILKICIGLDRNRTVFSANAM